MDDVDYAEGIFVGYRYYDEKGIKPLFPFGHGLSYTTFEYSNLTVSENEIKDDKTLTVMVDVTNTGDRDGMEIVQLYVSDKETSVRRPVRELKGFEKLFLKAARPKGCDSTLISVHLHTTSLIYTIGSLNMVSLLSRQALLQEISDFRLLFMYLPIQNSQCISP